MVGDLDDPRPRSRGSRTSRSWRWRPPTTVKIAAGATPRGRRDADGRPVARRPHRSGQLWREERRPRPAAQEHDIARKLLPRRDDAADARTVIDPARDPLARTAHEPPRLARRRSSVRERGRSRPNRRFGLKYPSGIAGRRPRGKSRGQRSESIRWTACPRAARFAASRARTPPGRKGRLQGEGTIPGGRAPPAIGCSTRANSGSARSISSEYRSSEP